MNPGKNLAAKLVKFGQRPVPITRRQSLALLVLGLAALGLGSAWHFKRMAIRNAIALNLWLATSFDDEPDLTAARAHVAALRPLFMRKRDPVSGEWLAHIDEPGQSLNQYVRAIPRERRGIRGAIQILPLGQFDQRQSNIVIHVAELVERFYGLPVRLLAPEPIPALSNDQRRGRGAIEQIFTLPLLQLLKARVAPEAACLLAITPMDLTPGPAWNFVFGQASLVDRVGIWSLHRLAAQSAPARMQLRRVAQVALHELGHMFGISHCIAYNCCMNGSNSQTESDATPLAFCPECDAKLVWRFRLDAMPRYQRLMDFAVANGLTSEAALWERCARGIRDALRRQG